MSLSLFRFYTFIITVLLTCRFDLSAAIPIATSETTVSTDLVPRGGNAPTSGYNDYSCRSPSHPNPVILLHGLLGNANDNLGLISNYLKSQNFCTFGLTYGSYSFFPIVGGLKSVDSSSQQITSFVQDVLRRTGAKQVDLVGHSEGAFMTMYLPKFRGLSSQVRKIVAIAPPTHGTDLSNLYDITTAGGAVSREIVEAAFNIIGCPACNDLTPNGGAVNRLSCNGQPIVQGGNTALIIASHNDEIVTPTETAFVDSGKEVAQGGSVTNTYVQDECPNDQVGHAGLAYSPWVWERTANWLDPSIKRTGKCYNGLPVKE